MAADAARAFWIARPGCGEIRAEAVPVRKDDEVLVRTEFSGISRGTEALIFNGHVPASEYQRMRAPFQQGDFPAPVKYGYSSVGVVEDGPAPYRGGRVFVLYPHQTRYVVPAKAAHVLPADVPSGRAVLAANLETALNGLWDAHVPEHTNVTVVGGGTVGCLVAWIAAYTKQRDVELVDVNPARAAVAEALGVRFRTADTASSDVECVIHASGAAAGLELAMRIAAFEATIVEMSWYGDRIVPLKLGEHFHAKRLTLKSSQVGTVAPSHRSGVSRQRRLQMAIAMLSEPALDVLITGESSFDDLPTVMPQLASAPGHTLCHRITYV